jgi:GTPase SAR1 family protein
MDIIILFLGGPGSGKTTYSQLLFDYYISLGRNVVYVNLDCSNEFLPKKNFTDIKSILIGDEILSELHIGPNSSIFFSMEYLQKNLKWLEFEISKFKLQNKRTFFFFDLPGQIELFTHHKSLKHIIKKLNRSNLISSLILSDSFFWFDKSIFHTIALSNLMILINMEIPSFHILTKTDLCKLFNLKKIDFEEKKFKIHQESSKSIFSWGKKIKFSIEDVILDYGMMNPIPINLTKSTQVLDLVKYLDRYLS